MATKITIICDRCGAEITEQQKTDNDTMVYINKQPKFTGELCDECLKKLLNNLPK